MLLAYQFASRRNRNDAAVILHPCTFENCRFERLEVSAGLEVYGTLRRCEVTALVRADRDEQLFDPVQIAAVLAAAGFKIDDGEERREPDRRREPDDELRVVDTCRLSRRMAHPPCIQ